MKATVKKIQAGCYEYRGETGTWTIDRDTMDNGREQWLLRDGPFPGGRAEDQFDTLREAIAFLNN